MYNNVTTVIVHKAWIFPDAAYRLSAITGFIDPVNIIVRKVTVFNCLCFLSWGRIAPLLRGLEILSCDVNPAQVRGCWLYLICPPDFYEHYTNEMVCIMREPYVPQRHARLQTAGSNLSPLSHLSALASLPFPIAIFKLEESSHCFHLCGPCVNSAMPCWLLQRY